MTTTISAPRPVPPAPLAPRPTWRWEHQAMRHLPQALLGLLVLVTGAVRLINLTGAPQRIDDEGTYVAQAYALLQYGELAHYTYWYDHPPLGWLQIAGWFLLTGGPDSASSAVAAGRGFMVVVTMITAALLWTLARRLGLSLAAATAAVAVFALSPLAVDLGRTVYLDNIATAWLLAALVLFSSPQQRLSAAFGGAACYGVAVLTKETMLLVGPAVLLLAWRFAAPRTRRYAAAVVGTVLGLMLAGYVLMAAIRNELFPGAGHVSLVDAVQFQLYGRDSGGSVFDAASLNHTTFQQWWVLDPVLLTAAVPAAVAGLAVRRLQPIATAVVLLAAMLLRDGYLPAPIVIGALPLIALLVAGVPDAALRWARARARRQSGRKVRSALLVGVLAATAVLGVSAGTTWAPVLRYLLVADTDAPLRQAQEWITNSVPRDDRLIVDDALWVDLVSEGRDRRDVVWFYKVDTDAEVQGWAPRGWRDYDWVVSSPSLRSGTPSTGVLADAVSRSAPVAVFGSGDARVELRRVGPSGATSAGDPANVSVGALVADRLDGSVDSALTLLRSGRADARLLATLGTLAAREPVLLNDLPAVPGEDAAGRPRRQLHLTAAGAELDRTLAFFRAQSGGYAPEAVEPVSGGVLVRFPADHPPVALPTTAPPVESGSSARLKVADLRTAVAPEVVEVFEVDGGPVGSLPTGGYGTSTGYRSLPSGTYTLATRPAADPSAPPVIRQTVQVQPGDLYTLALFDAADGSSVNAQLVLDDAPAAAPGQGHARLVEGAREPGVVSLAIDDPTGPPVVLADGVNYGLVTGYAPVSTGDRVLRLRSGDREWVLPTRVPSAAPVTFLLTDGPRGPVVHTVPDASASAPRLDRPGPGRAL